MPSLQAYAASLKDLIPLLQFLLYCLQDLFLYYSMLLNIAKKKGLRTHSCDIPKNAAIYHGNFSMYTPCLEA